MCLLNLNCSRWQAKACHIAQPSLTTVLDFMLRCTGSGEAGSKRHSWMLGCLKAKRQIESDRLNHVHLQKTRAREKATIRTTYTRSRTCHFHTTGDVNNRGDGESSIHILQEAGVHVIGEERDFLQPDHKLGSLPPQFCFTEGLHSVGERITIQQIPPSCSEHAGTY